MSKAYVLTQLVIGYVLFPVIFIIALAAFAVGYGFLYVLGLVTWLLLVIYLGDLHKDLRKLKGRE